LPDGPRRRGSLPAFAAYLLYAGRSALFFASYGTLANVYRIRVAHLDALQLVLVGTALEVAVWSPRACWRMPSAAGCRCWWGWR